MLNVRFRHPQLNTSQENPICLHSPTENDVDLRCHWLRLKTAKLGLIMMRACGQVSVPPLLTLRSAARTAVVGAVMLGRHWGIVRRCFPNRTAVIIPIHGVWTSRKTLIMSSLFWRGARGQFSKIAARNYAGPPGLWHCGGPRECQGKQQRSSLTWTHILHSFPVLLPHFAGRWCATTSGGVH